jgi:hypothetical protein
MEFLTFAEASNLLDSLDVQQDQEGDHLRLSLGPREGITERLVFGTPTEEEAANDDVRKVERDKGSMPGCVDGILHRLHLSEVGVIPVATWRPVLDLASFELATDEDWADFDAEAAMHQTNRDPLMLKPQHFHILGTIVKSMLESGEGPQHDLHIVSLETPFVMRVRHEGGLSIWCANDAVAAEIAEVKGAHES